MTDDDAPIPPVLILSTGRCGSTMISAMLNRHPKVLSLSEFFVPLGPAAFVWRTLSGERMWRILSRQSAGLHAMLKDGIVVEEGLYPHDDPGSRFSAGDLPPIMAVTLPHLTADYEALYDELEAFVRRRPPAPLADHYRALFAHLMARFGRRVWVERSGGSLMHGAKLLRLFPEARVVHVFRDGRDTAMSMSRHHNFQVMLAAMRKVRRFGVDPRAAFLQDRSRPVDVWVQSLFFRLFDARRLLEDGPGLAEFAGLWSDMIVAGARILADLPPERLLNLRFEDLQKSPREKLAELIRFIDPSLRDDGWLDEAAAMPRPTRSKFVELPAELRASLTRACAPGLELLGYPA